MEARELLNLMRPVIARIDGAGLIAQVEGGFDGFLGHDTKAIQSTSIFDYVTPEEGSRLASYFIEQESGAMETVRTPLPFRLNMIDADGAPQPVDVIPTAYEIDGERRGWVVVAVPVTMSTAPLPTLEAEMAGQPRGEVRKLLTTELATAGSCWLLVDFAAEVIAAADPALRQFSRVVERSIAQGWHPWTLTQDQPAALLEQSDVPEQVRAELGVLGYERIVAAPVRVNGEIAAAFLNLSVPPVGIDGSVIPANVMDRIKGLVNVTSLVLGRWQDRDALARLARHDSLTGLVNRHTFSDALADLSAATVLYVDVDDFKRVNDELGHQAGDLVLQEVARRIVASCRPSDIVGRLGGDEFAVILDGLDLGTAQVIGKRIVEAVRQPMEVGLGTPVTVSVGVASPRGGANVVDLADHAMLAAKRAGRNQLVVA